MTNKELFNKWYPKYYDRRETQTYDYELFIDLLKVGDLLKSSKKKIFEICCGTGRIMLPLADAGHEVHGIDMDNFMLARLMEKAENSQNIHVTKGNAITTDWGKDYDAVLMAGNIVMNIEDSEDPHKAQKTFVQKAYDALKGGGYLIMDNDCYSKPTEVFKNRSQPIVRDFGTDDMGVSAQMTYVWSTYDENTGICVNFNRLKLTAPDGEEYVKETKHVNHIPTSQQMIKWAEDVGFTVLNLWGNHDKKPYDKTCDRLIILAQKQ